jgi:hypothetical protein
MKSVVQVTPKVTPGVPQVDYILDAET